MNYEKKKCVTPVYSQNLTALGYLGRFVSVDPLAKNLPIRWLYTPQNANFYTYARNNPLVFFDPTGEKAETYSGFINEGKTAIASVQNAGTNPLTENPMVTAKELHR